MPTLPTLSVAHEVRALAQDLIREHHTHLLDANLLYVFTDQKRKRCDRVRLGSAAKMNALQRFLASGMDSVEDGPDFVILIGAFEWGTLGKDARNALVDHELSHCALFVKEAPEVRGDPATWRRIKPTESRDDFDDWRWGMRGHDLEEFADVIRRHGFWRHDPQELEFKAIALQLALPKDGTVRNDRVPVKA
jgi:hypothetical protein